MKDSQTGFVASVEATIRHHNMLTPGDTVVIAVSGGPDSVALLHALVAIRAAWSLELTIAHLNHGIRKEEAPKEAAFVEELASDLDLSCKIGFEDVKDFSKKYGFSIQEGAREARYRFLQDVAAERNAQKIALGHHANDNAESVLMHLLRGTGPRGLAGIPPMRDNTFIRPLIEISRHRILTFLQEHAFAYKTDRSNFEPKYLRNRVRHELMPLLKERFSADCVSSLNRLSSIVRTEEAYWEPVVEKALSSHVIEQGKSEVTMDIPGLRTLHPAVCRRLIRHIVAGLTGTLKRIRHNQVDAVLALVQKDQPSGAVHLARQVRVVRQQNRLVFRLGDQPRPPCYEYEIKAPENITIPEVALEVRFSTCPHEAVENRLQQCPGTTAYFDLKRVSFPLLVRNFRHGDRFVPLGMTGSQKVKSFFINKKVSPLKRLAYPLLLSKGEIIWVGGFRISDRVKVTKSTMEILRVDLVSLKPE